MKNTEKNLKGISGKLKIYGKGIVNYDGDINDPINKYYFGKKQNISDKSEKNINYAKKNFYKDENGDITHKIKISSNCIRHNLFKQAIPTQNSKLFSNPETMFNFIASKEVILRGFMYAEKNSNTSSTKRKSSISCTDAEQTSSNESYIEFYSTSGEKTKDGNKIHNKENIGEVAYEMDFFIDIKELQFLSVDSSNDRMMFNADHYELFKKYMSLPNRLPGFDNPIDNYILKTDLTQNVERGILLNQNQVDILVKFALESLLDFNIIKTNAFAKRDQLLIKPVYDCIEDENFIEIKSKEDIKNMKFEYENYYQIYE
jgi:hypothetical protein